MEELEERDVKKANDQYCQYEKLPILLKRFSFEEKIRIATFYSNYAILFDSNRNSLQILMILSNMCIRYVRRINMFC